MLSNKFMHNTKFWKKFVGGLVGCTTAFCILSSSSNDKSSNWKNTSESESALQKFIHSDNKKRELSTTPINHDKKLNYPICQKVIIRRSFPRLLACTNYTTSLCEEDTFPLTALVSYPGSGNTWVRHLIEIATGIFTGSVYFDHTLYARGFLGEKEDWSSGRTIVQKLHVKYDSAQPFKRGILIIREPVAATRSFVDFMESGHTGWASPTTFNRKEWPSFLLHSTRDWLILAKSWIESPVDLLVIHYENLVSSTVKEVRKIVKFLSLDDSRMDSECFLKSVEGSFHRKPPVWKINSPPPPKARLIIDNGINYLNQLLLKYGKEQIPLDKYSCYRNSSEKCVGKNG
ncbi:WSC domain-containing protein 1 [Folsomia candida]|uniref:WSC domain-containing protein 1 n=1 Tax=Folsomia candida TaxID=158441 RepID=UPI000B8EF685|nr:WSC domain-containing protein 1 [Folsomia candida]